MLTAADFDELSVPFMEIYNEYQTSVIVDIARRLANLNYASAAWQVTRLIQAGQLYESILSRLSIILNISEKELAKVLKEAGTVAMKFDNDIYRKAGLEPLPIKASPAMTRVYQTTFSRLNGILRNLTLTTANTGQEAFIFESDIAYLKIATGTHSYQQAIKEAVVNVASKGLEVIEYPSGRKTSLDAAVRRTVITGVGQLTGKLQLEQANNLGVDLVQTSAHIGARNTGEGPANHESWQGRIFSLSGTDPKYPDFYQVTGFGTGEGLNGYNCRHSWYPFFPGISENAYKEKTLKQYADRTVFYKGKEISFYEGTQIQRGIERKIRKTKRIIAGLKAAEQPTFEFDQKLKNYQAEMRSFILQTGIKRQRYREQVFA